MCDVCVCVCASVGRSTSVAAEAALRGWMDGGALCL